MSVADRVAQNVLLNPYAGTNRGRYEPIDSWSRRALIACYSCGNTLIGGVVEPLGWMCAQCIDRHRSETAPGSTGETESPRLDVNHE